VNQKAFGRNSGFTLIEIMIVVAILTIAVALAVPEFLRWNVQSQLRQATSEIATQLMLARMAAMNRNRSVDVTVQTTGGAVHISAVAPSSGAAIIKDKVFDTCRIRGGEPGHGEFFVIGLEDDRRHRNTDHRRM